MYIMLDGMYVTMSISTGLYPNLDLWTANKLQLQLHNLDEICFCEDMNQKKYPSFLNKNINVSVCLMKHPAIKLNLSICVRKMISFMAWLVYAWGNKTLDKRLSWLHSWCESAGGNNSFWPCRNQTPGASMPVQTLVNTLIMPDLNIVKYCF